MPKRDIINAHLTKTVTPFRRYKYLRAPYGIYTTIGAFAGLSGF